MHTVSVSRVFHAPLDEVWNALDDFGGIWKYNPGVESSRIVNDIATGEGARRECLFYDGERIEETIVDYEFEERYTVELTDVGPYPLHSSRVDIEITASDDHHTEVTMTGRFHPKYGPLGWAMAKMKMIPTFEERFEAVLEGLATHLHTGQPIGENGAPVDAAAQNLTV